MFDLNKIFNFYYGWWKNIDKFIFFQILFLFLLGLFGFTLVLFIGLRHEIGNDWFHYLDYYKTFIDRNYISSTKGLEIGYSFVNWVSAQFNFGMYGVNLICGIIFMYGSRTVFVHTRSVLESNVLSNRRLSPWP